MIQKVTLPALGETVDTSTIERWVKQEGDTVAKGDVLCEITTDKATLEVESYQAGTLLKIVAPVGAELPVGALIAIIGKAGDAIPADLLAEAPKAASRPAAAPERPAAKAPAKPAAKPPTKAAGPGPAAAEGFQRILLPALGETVDTSTIERWVKQEGDTVAKGDVLCEITTDKATLEVESYHAGTLLKIVAPVGAELPVGALIAIIGKAGTTVPDGVAAEAGQPEAAAEPTAAPAVAAAPTSLAQAPVAGAGGRRFVSPRARRRARELGVPLEQVRGTGPGGRIVEADVVGAADAVKASPLARKVAKQAGVDLASVAGTGPGGKVMKADVQAAPPPSRDVEFIEVLPLTKMRRIVADRMLLSKQTIPCYYLTMDADMTETAALRAKLNQKVNGQPRVSFNDFVIKACGKALRSFPSVNSRWSENGIERRGAANVGLAVGLDEGLIVPVVRNADRKDLREIARETVDLAQRARSKRLIPDEYQDGCITVTNLGMFGIRSFIPVVNPGESCILGLGVIQEQAVVQQGKIQVRQMMTMTLSVDHRMVDGAVGAQFLEAVRDLLEAPKKLAAEVTLDQ